MPDHQERGGYSPAPKDWGSNSGSGKLHQGGLLSRGDIFVAVSLLLCVAVIAVVTVVVAKQTNVQNEFVAECIEFHSVKRCQELWHYGRTDLARRN